jgi:tRNA (guanine37-N1)-methyltransferase
MVMMAEPLARCLAAIRLARQEPADQQAPLVLFSPAGQPLRHAAVQQWADSPGAVLLCGRYEGVDQRFIDAEVDVQISLGDFVLSGGEIAAMALLDAVARLQPGVLGDAASHQQDSFNPAVDGLLDCPHYTRPEVWSHEGVSHPVPDVLLSGHHQRIERHRRDQRLLVTARCRPDLLAAAQANGTLDAHDQRVLQAAAPADPLTAAQQVPSRG